MVTITKELHKTITLSIDEFKQLIGLDDNESIISVEVGLNKIHINTTEDIL